MPQRPQHPGQDLVAAGDDRGRPPGGAQQSRGGRLAVRRGERAGAHRDVEPGQGAAQPAGRGRPLPGRQDLGVAVHQGDPAVTQPVQVLDRRGQPGPVVAVHAAGQRQVAGVAVHQHVRCRAAQQLLDGRPVVLIGQREQQPVHPALPQQPDVLGVQPGIHGGVQQQQGVPRAAQGQFGAVRDLRGQRVGDVAHHEPDRHRRPAAQALREQVGLVAEGGRGLEHPVPHHRADVRVAGQHP